MDPLEATQLFLLAAAAHVKHIDGCFACQSAITLRLAELACPKGAARARRAVKASAVCAAAGVADDVPTIDNLLIGVLPGADPPPPKGS